MMREMGDLISRSALLEVLRKSHAAHAETGRDFSLLCRDIRLVKECPAVDAVPVVHGKPEPYMVQCIGSNGTVVAEYQEGWYCPFCGESGVKNYCPNCGAKMDGERKDDG